MSLNIQRSVQRPMHFGSRVGDDKPPFSKFVGGEEMTMPPLKPSLFLEQLINTEGLTGRDKEVTERLAAILESKKHQHQNPVVEAMSLMMTADEHLLQGAITDALTTNADASFAFESFFKKMVELQMHLTKQKQQILTAMGNPGQANMLEDRLRTLKEWIA